MASQFPLRPLGPSGVRPGGLQGITASGFIYVVSILRTLLGSAIDYAGLFPPASHAMSAAIREYGEILESEGRWALGRFVIPAAKLVDFRELKGGAWSRLAPASGYSCGTLIDTGVGG